MFKYFLSNKAVDDLSKIWEYTFEVWSENQADKYYNELIHDCQELCENQNLGRNYIEIDIGIYGYNSGKHIIFYRKLNDKNIEVIRFLHSKMDLKIKIQE